MVPKRTLSRRRFMFLAGTAGAGLALSGCSESGKSQGAADTAIELLDRQHGLLHRAIFILEEIRGGMDARMDLPPEIIQGTVDVIRRFVVEYHQPMEEKYLFPAFDAAKKMSGLIGILREQHAVGVQLTELLKKLSTGFSPRDVEQRRTIGSAIHHFCRMYLAHADREDTVLFPVFRQLVPAKAYAELSANFQKDDKQAMGQNGFDEAVQKLAGYEELLGIGDLAAFTPNVEDLS